MPRSENAASTGSVPPVRTSTGSRPRGARERAPGGRSAALGVEAAMPGELGRERQLGALGQRARAAAPRARADDLRRILARRDPHGQVAASRPAGRSCAPRRRRRGGRRARLGGRADVELVAAAASAGRAPTSASSPAPLGSDVPAALLGGGRRSIPARSGSAGGRRDRGARRRAPCAARGRRSARRRRTCPNARSASPVRTSRWAKTMPRVASVSAGVSASTMPESKTITASAPRSSARTHSPTSSEPVSSAPSISTRTWTGSSPASAISQATCSSGRKLPLSSVAPRA